MNLDSCCKAKLQPICFPSQTMDGPKFMQQKFCLGFESLNSSYLKTWCIFAAPGLYFRGDLCVQASPGCVWTLPEMIQEFCSTNGCCDPRPIWLVLECVKVSASVNTTRTNTSLPSDDVPPHSDWQPFLPPTIWNFLPTWAVEVGMITVLKSKVECFCWVILGSDHVLYSENNPYGKDICVGDNNT